MEAVMSEIEYTKEDLLKLKTMVAPGSVLETYLDDLEYDPKKFKEFMKKLPKQYKFLYQIDLGDLPMMINDKTIQGLLNWRFSIGK
jgi:hypothetical protein